MGYPAQSAPEPPALEPARAAARRVPTPAAPARRSTVSSRQSSSRRILVSRNSDSLHKSRSAAPGWQGARSAHTGSMREYVSDEQRSQPRGPQRGSRVGVEEDAPP